jgi:hypothetical protein
MNFIVVVVSSFRLPVVGAMCACRETIETQHGPAERAGRKEKARLCEKSHPSWQPLAAKSEFYATKLR